MHNLTNTGVLILPFEKRLASLANFKQMCNKNNQLSRSFHQSHMDYNVESWSQPVICHLPASTRRNIHHDEYTHTTESISLWSYDEMSIL